MNPSNYRVRRATVDDLGKLKGLWESMHYPADELEKRLTEFQVVESADGQLAGALGVQIVRPHGWLHSEAYRDFGVADELRPLLFQRIQSLASNHGVLRLWTRENSPFWTKNGFQPAGADVLKKLPAEWPKDDTGWLTLQLKNEEAIVSVEKELAMLLDAEKQRTARTLERARTLKTFATLIALILGIAIMGAAVYVWYRNSGFYNSH
jgi:N-acetylglutamate synthase-like GNAT family acetyltransferase